MAPLGLGTPNCPRQCHWHHVGIHHEKSCTPIGGLPSSLNGLLRFSPPLSVAGLLLCGPSPVPLVQAGSVVHTQNLSVLDVPLPPALLVAMQ